MLSRIVSSQLQTLVSSSTSSSACRSASRLASHRSFVASHRSAPSSYLARDFSSDAENVVNKSNKRFEDVVLIATSQEREELEAKLEVHLLLEDGSRARRRNLEKKYRPYWKRRGYITRNKY